MFDAAPATPRLASRSGRLLAVTAAVVTFAAVPALANVPLLDPAPASAASSGTSIDATLRFLQDAQRRDGGFTDDAKESFSNPSVSVWATLALASAGINPKDQKAQNGKGLSAWTYLTGSAVALSETGDAARLLLVARAAGESGRSVGGVDLVALLQQRQQADGSFLAGATGVQVDATAFAVLALSAASGAEATAAAARGADWLESIHRLGRGWGQTVDGQDQVDVTGLVLQALSAVGRTKAAKDAANNGFLSENLDASGSGGFPLLRGGKVDPVATAWAVQGLRAAGIDPSAWGPDALTYLRDVRRSSDGSIEGSVLRTAQTTGALNRRVLPLAAVARAPATPPKTEKEKEPRKEPERERPTSSGSTGVGSGSTGSGSGDGVTSGGGGSGASVYQGAQSGSAGSTAGAAVSTTPTGAASGARGTGGSKTSEQTAAPTPKQKKQEQPTTTGGGGPEVSGTVVSGTQDKEDAAAAGLRSAGAGDGDGDPWVTRGLGGTLLLVAGLGAVIEGRRPRRRIFSITEVEGPLLDAPPARRGWFRAGTEGGSGFRGRFRRADRGVISDATPSDDGVAASTATTTPVQL